MGKQSGEAGTRGEAGCNPKPSKASDNGLPQPEGADRSQPPKCPECGSSKVWRDGLRYLSDGRAVQRYLCRLCGHRFSQAQVKLNIAGEQLESFHPGSNLAERTVSDGDLPIKKALNNSALSVAEDFRVHNVTNLGKDLNTLCPNLAIAEYCAPEGGAKNSAGAVKALMEEKAYAEGRAAGATEKTIDIQGKILEFLWWMKKNGYKESSIKSRGEILRRLMRLGANLLNPENVKDCIARQENWSYGRRANVVHAYDLFAKWAGLKWTPPKISVPEKLPFIPLEREIDDLIAGCSRHIAVALQIMKETGARAGEVFRLKWSDIDFENGTIRITPEKGSNARIFKMSGKLIRMLNHLPRSGERIFSRYKDLNSMRRTFERQRKRIAHKLANPRLLQISFHTLRHWKATMEYAKTKDILYVMQVLGHKNIKNTLKYTQLIKFKEDQEFICKIAKTPKEAKELIEAGFEYVFQRDGLIFFRKRK